MTASLTDETEALFTVLRQSADGETVAAIEHFVAKAPDRALCRINPLVFAARYHLDEEPVIGAFLACGAARHFRAVVERAVSRLRRRARLQHDAEERAFR